MTNLNWQDLPRKSTIKCGAGLVEYTGDYGAWDTGARSRDSEGVEVITGLLIPLVGLVLVALAVRWRVWL